MDEVQMNGCGVATDSLSFLVRSWRGQAGALVAWIKQFEEMEEQYGGFQNIIDKATARRHLFLQLAKQLSDVIKANT